jgi:hypothetical protein
MIKGGLDSFPPCKAGCGLMTKSMHSQFNLAATYKTTPNSTKLRLGTFILRARRVAPWKHNFSEARARIL